MRRVGIAGSAVGVILACVSTPALAAPGDHIRTGDAVLTPSVTTGIEYHTNVYLADGYNTPVVGAPAWFLNPELTALVERPDFRFEIGGGYNLKLFIDTAPKDTAEIQNLNQFTEFDAHLGLNALTQSVVGIRLDDRFQIKNNPAELQTSEANANVIVTSNEASGGFVIRPGGAGSALEIATLGQVGLDNYNVPRELIDDRAATGAELNFNSRVSYGPVLDTTWKFLPKTSVLLQGSVIWNRWSDNLISAFGPETENNSYGIFLGKPNSTFWRAMTGVKGSVTPKVSVMLVGGYGQAWYDEESVLDEDATIDSSSSELDLVGEEVNAENFARDLKSAGEGLLVNAQVSWAPSKGHNVILGYRKDFQDAFFTNYVVYNYLFLRYEGLYANRFGATAEITARFDSLHGEVVRADNNFGAKLQGAYKITSYLSTGLALGWAERACGNLDCANDEFYSSQYDDFSAQLGVTFTY